MDLFNQFIKSLNNNKVYEEYINRCFNLDVRSKLYYDSFVLEGIDITSVKEYEPSYFIFSITKDDVTEYYKLGIWISSYDDIRVDDYMNPSQTRQIEKTVIIWE